MKLKTLCLISHVAATVLTAAAVGAALLAGPLIGLIVGATAAVLVGLGMGFFMNARVSHGLKHVSESLSGRHWDVRNRTGLVEFDDLTAILSEHERRVTTSSGRTQEQIQEIHKLLGQIDRRGDLGRTAADRDQSVGRRLREVLTGLVRAADSDLSRVLTLAQEIETNTKAMSAGTSDQSEAVSRTTTYVEQMSANIDLVTQNADAANQAANAVQECAGEALSLVQELIDGMERIHRHVEASWRKLRALGDRTQEIGSIVETIAGIAARTDMLALNASIESVRAGEHGRGFAVVADEVRKLAEQAAQATKEVAGLIETVQTETQDSINVMAHEQEQVEAEVGRVNSAGQSLERISQTSSDSVQRVGEITRATQQQLRFTQEVVLAMERIAEAAKGIRNRADGVSWTTNTLSGLVRQLDGSLSPLRGCLTDHTAPERNDQTDRHGESGDGDQVAQNILNGTQTLLAETQAASQTSPTINTSDSGATAE